MEVGGVVLDDVGGWGGHRFLDRAPFRLYKTPGVEVPGRRESLHLCCFFCCHHGRLMARPDLLLLTRKEMCSRRGPGVVV